MKSRNPRHGSMQFWPRKRAQSECPVVKAWASSTEALPLGFAGYKVGMTHIQFTDNGKTSVTKGQLVASPVTIIECPPIKVCGARAYKKDHYGQKIVAQSMVDADKEVSRYTNSVRESKNQKITKIADLKAEDADKVVIICYTQPKLVGFGKKTPEVFEVALGGSVADQIAYATDNLGKEISVESVFKAGQFLDAHAVTTGRGTQGPVKRFGVAIRASKSEKTKRGPGSISGGWVAQMHMMYRVAFAGQTGYHKRTEYNKLVYSIETDISKINPKGGFVRYGNVKNTYLLIRGSIPGPEKRFIRLNKAIRTDKESVQAPTIEYISTESKQN